MCQKYENGRILNEQQFEQMLRNCYLVAKKFDNGRKRELKLAEALQERADLNRNIERLKVRLNNNVLVQEGEETAEDPEKLKQELDRLLERLTYLIAQINRTNCETMIDGQTLTEMIARKDMLSLKIHLYKEIVNVGSQAPYRARNTEIKIKPAISVVDW